MNEIFEKKLQFLREFRRTHRSSILKIKFLDMYFSVAVGISVIFTMCCVATPVPVEYPLRLQPELDGINVAKYLKNERLMRLQFKCLVFDGPCDIIGRWVKPRAKAGLLGQCLKCTEVQKKWLDEWMEVLIDKFPDMYRAAVAKYIDNEGIKISDEEKAKIESAFREDAVEGYLDGIQDVKPAKDNKNEEGSGNSTTVRTTGSEIS